MKVYLDIRFCSKKKKITRNKEIETQKHKVKVLAKLTWNYTQLVLLNTNEDSGDLVNLNSQWDIKSPGEVLNIPVSHMFM